MKVELQENQSEITLGQFQELTKLQERTDLNTFQFVKRKVKIFTGLSYREISGMNQDDLTDIIKTIDKALNQEVKFQERFEMNGVEFGFIPNFDDMKAKEYFDLSTYNTDVETLHKLMAILFRPIKTEALGKYEIVNYQGSKEWADVMKRTPLNIVNGALVFFSTLAIDCNKHIQKSILEEQERSKQAATLKSGVGTRRLTEWLKVRFGGLSTSKI